MCQGLLVLSVQQYSKISFIISILQTRKQRQRKVVSCPRLSNKNAVELIFEFSSVRLQSAGTRTSLTARSLPPTEGIPAGPGAALLCADMPGGVGGPWSPCPLCRRVGLACLGSHAPQKWGLLLTKCALTPTHLFTGCSEAAEFNLRQ